MGRFDGKVVIVTGASSGIGRAVAMDMANENAKIVLASRNEEAGNSTLVAIKEKGAMAIFVKTDVSKDAEVKELIEKALSTFGRLDLAFNNAGIEQQPMPLPEQTEQLYQRVMDTNVKGVWSCMKYQIPAMLETGGGSIVNTSSFSGIIAFATIPIYVASKHAVVGLTKSVALEYAKRNIRVNAILPGSVENTGTFERSFGGNTDSIAWAKSIHPVGRLASPKEISAAVLFLLSEEAKFMTGHSMVIDGGYSAG